MTLGHYRRVGCTILVLLASACDPGAPYCDRAAAENALADAAPGDTVTLGACEIVGPLHVPPGVSLAGSEGTVVVAPEDSGAILLIGSEPATSVHDLDVRVEGRIGILARGGGAVRIADVHIDAVHGIALGAAGLDSLALERVTMQGPIDETNANDASFVRVAAAAPASGECPDPTDCECTPGDTNEQQVCDETGHWATWTATHGLFVNEVALGTFSDVSIAGFAQWGAVLMDSAITWNRGGVRDVLGIGVRQVGGSLTMRDAAAERTFQGLRGDRPYAFLATDASVTAERLRVSDNDRFGMLLSQSSGSIVDLIAQNNGDAALWIADSDALDVSGAATLFSNNSFAGVVVVGSTNVSLSSATIETTVEAERAVGALGLLRVGDGLHLVDSPSGLRVTDVLFRENARAGLIADLGAAMDADVVFSGVSVQGSGSQLGAIAATPATAGQLTTVSPAGWDTGIVRDATVGANDEAFTGTLSAVTEALPAPLPSPGDAVAVVAPMF